MFDAFAVSASGMEAQRLRLNVIASNLANVETTKTSTGGAYRRKDVVFASSETPFGELLRKASGTPSGVGGAGGVRVAGIIEDSRPFKQQYDPSHPHADSNGYVAYPNVNTVEEMVNMISASRSYDANVSAFKAAREMYIRALELGE